MTRFLTREDARNCRLDEYGRFSISPQIENISYGWVASNDGYKKMREETDTEGRVWCYCEDQPVLEIGRWGEKRWLLNGKLHRDDGPAIEWKDGAEWFRHGEHHRTDGPAVDRSDRRCWYIDGEFLSETQFIERTNTPVMEVTIDGDKVWKLNDQWHRVDGPAIERVDGSKEWFQNGQWHREDGPAIEWADGTRQWWVNGQQHRLDGPAAIFPPQEKGGPWQKEWRINGVLHRESGPAIEFFNGTSKWYIDGREISRKDKAWPGVLWNAIKLTASACLLDLLGDSFDDNEDREKPSVGVEEFIELWDDSTQKEFLSSLVQEA